MNVGTDSYTLKMLDQITGPLNRVLETLNKVNDKMDDLNKASSSGFLSGLGKGAAVAGAAFTALAAGLYGVYKVMEFGIGLTARFALSLGRAALEAAKFRARTLTTFSTMYGSEEAAQKQFAGSIHIGQATGATTLDVVDLTKGLLTAGFKDKGLDAARAAALDVQAAHGNDKMQEFLYAIKEIYSKGTLQSRQLTQQLGMFISTRDIKASIGQRLGLKGADVNKQVEGLIKGGKVDATTGILATYDAIKKQLHEKKLGEFAGKMGGDSLTGLLSNTEHAGETFLAQLEFEKMPGMKSLKQFLKDFNSFFDLSTKEGKMLKGVVEDILNTLFGGLSRITKDDLARFFQAGLGVAKELSKTIEAAWNWLDQLLHGDTSGFLNATGQALYQVGKEVGKGIWDGFWATTKSKEDKDRARLGGMTEGQYGAMGKELGEQAIAAGDLAAIWKRAGGKETAPGFRAAVEYLAGQDTLPPALAEQVQKAQERLGLVQKSTLSDTVADLQQQVAEMENVGRDIGEGAPKGAREASESHSPSRVMERIGHDLVDGLVLGVQRRMERLSEGGEELAGFDAQLLAALRRIAHRTGAPVVGEG